MLFALVSGAWDKSAAIRYVEDFKHHALTLAEHPWAHISYLDLWQLGTPDVEPVLRELEAWVLGHNIKYTAAIYAPSAVKKFQLGKMIKSSKHNDAYRHFDCEQEAIEWLKSKGFLTDLSAIETAIASK